MDSEEPIKAHRFSFCDSGDDWHLPCQDTSPGKFNGEGYGFGNGDAYGNALFTGFGMDCGMWSCRGDGSGCHYGRGDESGRGME